ncbi:hypothetical protein QCZ28_17790 [Micromonospora sp. DH14]|nr:hypothetical protein [Micromonospora sp. DH14]MDG9675872.1 hypothetical protein [Micromonospora sp. DH14]
MTPRATSQGLLCRVGDRRGGQQPRGVRVSGGSLHGVRGAFLHDPTAVQYRNPVGQLLDDCQVMADE